MGGYINFLEIRGFYKFCGTCGVCIIGSRGMDASAIKASTRCCFSPVICGSIKLSVIEIITSIDELYINLFRTSV